MHYLVTGGAGFIGSHIVDRHINKGDVAVYDNLSSGRKNFLDNHTDKDNFEFIEADLLDKEQIIAAMNNVDFVYHIAANPDVRYGVEQTRVDLEQGPIVTHNLLEAMRVNEVRNIAFSSTSTVYGEPTVFPTPEDYGPMIPISLYGASKLACEALITAYAHSFDMNAWIFRFANIIGNRGTHGILVDFIEKLKKNPQELEILGDGTQSKSYLLVEECVDAMLFAVEHTKEKVNIFNLGCDDRINVTRITEILVEELGLEDVRFNYTGGDRGWVGDVPKMMLSVDEIKNLGWKANLNSEQAVKAAAKVTADALWRNQS